MLIALVPLLLTAAPDIVMIAVDDLRPFLGCYGEVRAKTPNIDRLATRGVLFERAYCQYAKCGPSRLSLMSGLRPDSVGVFSHRKGSDRTFRKRRPDATMLPAWFKKQGYETRGFGKIHHDGFDLESDWSQPPQPGREREMWEVVDAKNPTAPTTIADRWDCPVLQSPDVQDEHLFAGRMTAKAVSVLRERKADVPLFLAVGYRRPHLPFVAPQKYFDLHKPDTSWLTNNPEPPAGAPVLAFFNSDGYIGAARRFGPKMPTPPTKAEAPNWNGYELRSYLGVPNTGPLSEAKQLELLQAYAACVSYIDAQIGKLLEAIQLDQTIVVLWSDHGWHLGELSAWSKMTNYEIATRVPLLIAAPGMQPGRTHSLAELVDLYPTLCELAGLETPEHVEGESLVPALRKPGQLHQQQALSQHGRYGERYMGRALRTDRYRYVAWREEQSGEVVERELYDLGTTTVESANLANDPAHAELVAKLDKQLRAAFTNTSRGRLNSDK